MTPNIVCGIDQSPEARAATRLAAALTERLNGRLSLVHAVAASASSAMPSWPYPASIGDTSVRGSLHEAGERLMSETLEDIAPCDAIGRIEDGHAPERICVAAEEEDAALIVLGTRGQGASRAALLGSVSLATIRGTSRPVVVVPPAATRGRSLDGECLVCGIGGPDDTGPARVAARLARALDMPLTFAHVAPRQDAELSGSTIAAVPLAAPAQPSERPVLQGRAALTGATDTVREVAPELAGARMLAGDPAEQLRQLAEQERAAMVVVGTRGRGALGSGLLGSVSHSLACSGTTPVVVCPERATAGA